MSHQDSDAPVDLYIAAYDDPDAAKDDWAAITELASEGTIKVDGLVLDGRGHDVAAAGRFERFRGAAQCEVVRLGAAAGEHELGRFGADERRHRAARVVHHGFGALAEMMDARRIAEVVDECADDRLDGLGGRRGGCVVIEVRAHDRNCTTSP